MATPEAKQKDKLRLATAEEKRKTRQRKATPEALRRAKGAKARRVSATKTAARAHTEKAYANRLKEIVQRGGTWRQAAQAIAEAEGRSVEDLPTIMPPSYVSVHDAKSLQYISEMYGSSSRQFGARVCAVGVPGITFP